VSFCITDTVMVILLIFCQPANFPQLTLNWAWFSNRYSGELFEHVYSYFWCTILMVYYYCCCCCCCYWLYQLSSFW